jgi:PPOX class probable F420-dependent enzyme
VRYDGHAQLRFANHPSKTHVQLPQQETYMPLKPEVQELLSRPNFAHLATLMPDGSPNVTPVWIGVRGDSLVIGTGEGSLKVRNLRRERRLGLSVVDFQNPYEELQVRGRVVEFRDDSSFEIMDEISLKYSGKEFPFRNPEGRVALLIEVEKARYTKLPFQHTPPA